MMQTTLFLLVSFVTIGLASFGPNVRIYHHNPPGCYGCAITLGPGTPSHQPIYTAFQVGDFGPNVHVMFQRSTDAGRTWLATDLLIGQGAKPSITTDSDGSIYIVYRATDSTSNEQVSCVRSIDGGTTWTTPARVDDRTGGSVSSTGIAADSAGNLLCVWSDGRTGSSHIWSSVSTDRGETWSRNVQVDEDTTGFGSFHADAFVQPGTNHYLVTAEAPCLSGHLVGDGAFLYRSTDCGQTFEPGVQLNTLTDIGSRPHVVADRDHIICDYFGSGWTTDTITCEARTFYTQADSWGSPVSVTNLDSSHALYYSGGLAISGDGRVHTVLMICDTADDWRYDVFYTSSSDYGVSWSDIEVVNDDTTGDTYYTDIDADMAGHAYVGWTHGGELWFATNNPAAIAEEPMQPSISSRSSPTVVRGELVLGGNGDSPSEREDARYSPHFPAMSRAALLDISGREVMDLKPGANDVRALASGVYFVREAQAQAQTQAVRKVLVTR
jgi:hypothetical protein